jgi:hypothetical protein
MNLRRNTSLSTRSSLTLQGMCCTRRRTSRHSAQTRANTRSRTDAILWANLSAADQSFWLMLTRIGRLLCLVLWNLHLGMEQRPIGSWNNIRWLWNPSIVAGSLRSADGSLLPSITNLFPARNHLRRHPSAPQCTKGTLSEWVCPYRRAGAQHPR